MLPMPSGTTHTLLLSAFINFWFIGKFIFYLYHCVSLKLFDRALNVKISVSISNKESSFNSSTKFTFLSHAVINLLAPLRSTLDKRVWTNPSCGSWGFLSQRTNPNDAVDIHNIWLWWSITSRHSCTSNVHNTHSQLVEGLSGQRLWSRCCPHSTLIQTCPSLSSQNEPFYFRALCFPAFEMSLRPSLTPNIYSWIFFL